MDYSLVGKFLQPRLLQVRPSNGRGFPGAHYLALVTRAYASNPAAAMGFSPFQ
jgi:hypothetical protein